MYEKNEVYCWPNTRNFFLAVNWVRHLKILWLCLFCLTHWGPVTHICVSKLSILGPENGLSPGRRQAIIWTNGAIFLIGPLGTNFSELLIGIQTFSFTKMHLQMSSAKWRPFCLGLNVLYCYQRTNVIWSRTLCTAELIWYTLKVHILILWNIHDEIDMLTFLNPGLLTAILHLHNANKSYLFIYMNSCIYDLIEIHVGYLFLKMYVSCTGSTAHSFDIKFFVT